MGHFPQALSSGIINKISIFDIKTVFSMNGERELVKIHLKSYGSLKNENFNGKPLICDSFSHFKCCLITKMT